MNHGVHIERQSRNNHGYPFRAVCDCGWHSATYATEHAARDMGEFHMGPPLKN